MEKIKLSEATYAVYTGNANVPRDYDPSVFCEGVVDGAGNVTLYIPYTKRLRWFKTDYPEGRVIPSAPVFAGKRVTVTASLFLTKEDFVANQPAAVNSCTRILSDDDYLVDTVVTRAMSRVLRDAGYDLPADAHLIEGWTPLKKIEGDAPVSEEVMESGVIIPAGLPELPTIEMEEPKPVENPKVEKAEDVTPPEMESVTIPEEIPEQPEQLAMEMPQSQPVEKPKEEKTPEITPENVMAYMKRGSEIEKPKELEQVPAPAMEDISIPMPANTEPGEITFEELVEKAEEEMSYQDALSYKSRLLTGKSVEETAKERILFFVKKAMRGTTRDKDLGYACAIVAKERGFMS